MNVRQWLGRARSLDREMAALEKARQDALDAATRITQNYQGDGAQSSKDPHAKLDRFAEYISFLDKKHDELIQAKKEITEAICSVEDGRLRAILFDYYVNCASLEEISYNQHYSYRHVKRLRRMGVEEIEKRWPTMSSENVI